ncbi:unnamed protein product [Cochlearia groenlandica]
MGVQFSHIIDRSNSAMQDNNNNLHKQEEEDLHEDHEKSIMNSAGKNGTSMMSFKVPLHYPKYTKIDYEKMPECQLDQLLREYGLPLIGDSKDKRNFAIGAFLWSS